MYRTTHPTGYDDVATLRAGLEARWTAHASTRNLPTSLDEAYDCTFYDYGAVAALEVATARYTATFTGPRLPVHASAEGVDVVLDRGHATRIREAIPFINSYLGAEQDRFLARAIRDLEADYASR